MNGHHETSNFNLGFLLMIALSALALSCSQHSGAPLYQSVPTEEARAAGTVLFVLSAAPEQTLANGETRPTGYFLNEFYEPYQAVVEAGYEVVIATPEGNAPVVDPESLEDDYWQDDPQGLVRAQALVADLEANQAPLSLALASEQVERFQAVVVPGGQGVMVDLLDNPDLHRILIRLGELDRPVGLICHAPAILARLPAGSHRFEGRQVTSVSGFEEWYIETFVMGAKAEQRKIGRELERSGFRYLSAQPKASYAVRDCNLVTSQNPFSGASFNAKFIAALEDWRAGGRCERRSSE